MTDQQFLLVPASDVSALVNEVKALREEMRALQGKRSDWHKIKDAAQQLGVSVSTVRRRIDAGELEARGHGALRMVRLP